MASYPTEPHSVYASSEVKDSEKEVSPFFAKGTLLPLKPVALRAWLIVVWPLILHALITLIITAFMLIYVNNRNFNLEQRRPLVALADGAMIPWIRYAPLQTDITTLLSVLLAVLRLIAACWLGSLCWRCAFVLMEEFGLRPTQLRSLVSYGITAAPLIGAPEKGRWLLRSIILIALLVVLPAQLAAPVLTGSITWLSSYPTPENLNNATVPSMVTPDYGRWNDLTRMRGFSSVLESWIGKAAYRPFLAWGLETPNVAMKRYVQNFTGIEVNRTVGTVLLPYFAVQGVEWIDNPNSTLSASQLAVFDGICPKLNMTKIPCAIAAPGSVALIPDTPWVATPSNTPTIVAERRLMVYHAPGLTDNGCLSEGGGLDPNVTAHLEAEYCWKFAWVTYSAGAAVCDNCRLSSHATVQNDTALVLEEAYMTTEALRMMPSVISQMVSGPIADVTCPKWENINDHVIGLLTRSYSGAWMTLTDRANNERGVVLIPYSVSPHTTRASVRLLRVYIWLGLQSLITFSGILFLYIHAQSNSPLIGDTTLAAFHLDSSSLHDSGAYNRLWGGAARKVELQGDHLVVRVG